MRVKISKIEKKGVVCHEIVYCSGSMQSLIGQDCMEIINNVRY